MPMTPRWYNDEKTIYLFHFSETGLRDWNEYRRGIKIGMQEISQVDHPVVMLFDPLYRAMPSGNPLPHLRYAFAAKPDNVVAAISIVHNRFAIAAMNWVKRLGFYTWFHMVDSYGAAQQIIDDVLEDTKLPSA